MDRKITVVQMLPALDSGGVERGTLEIADYLVKRGHRSIVISSGGRMCEELLAQGSEHVDWPVGKKSLTTLRYIWKVRALLNEVKPDILHLRSRLPAWIGYFAWKGMAPESRPHLITSVHGPYSVGRYSAVMVKGERVIGVSNMIQHYITSNYPDVDKGLIRVIHRGVDPEQYCFGFQPDAQWVGQWYADFPQMKGKTLLTLPGRLTRWKGQEDFIKVIAALVAQGHDVHGVIAGGAHPKKTEYAKSLQDEIDRLGLGESITMVGHRSDLKQLMAISAITFSLTNEPEAFGRTTIESLSMGVPVIAYAHGGVEEQLAEVCPDGLVKVGDVDTVIKLTGQWLTEAPTVNREHSFTLEKMCSGTLSVYDEVLNQSGNR